MIEPGGAHPEGVPPSFHELIDRLLDRECPPREREALMRRVLSDPRAAREFHTIQRALSRLDPSRDACPDLTGSVLARVHRRRRFLPRRVRAMVSGGRLIVAGALLIGVAVVALIQQHHPQVTLNPEPKPLTQLMTAGESEVGNGLRNIISTTRGALDPAPSRIGAARPNVMVAAGPLEMGDTSDVYARPVRFAIEPFASPISADPKPNRITIDLADVPGYAATMFTPLGVADAGPRVVGGSPSRIGLSMLVLPDGPGTWSPMHPAPTQTLRFDRMGSRPGDVP